MSTELEPDTRFPSAVDLRSTTRLKVRPETLIPAAVNRGPHRLNSILGWVLIAVLAIAPIPLASNRPAFWTIWAAIIGLLAILYGASLIIMRAPARLPISRYWPEATCFGLLLLWLVVQILPIGRWLPESLTLAPAIGLPTRTFSLDPGSTTMTLLNFATYGLLFLLVAQAAANRRRARFLLFSLFLVVVAFAVYGLVSLVQLGDTLLGFEKLYYKGNATGTFVNRNSFATFLAAGLAMGVPLLLDNNQGKRRSLGHLRTWVQPMVVVVGILFIGATLLATQSRMGAAAGLAGTVVTLVLSFVGQKSSARWWVLGLMIVAGFAVVSFYGVGTLQRYMLSDVAEGRDELYRQIWPAIMERPWTGYGGGSFPTVFAAFQHAPLGSGDTVWDKAHSTYLSLWFEMGLVAGSLPLLVILGLMLRAAFSLRDASSRTVSIAAIGVTIVFALHSVVDFSAEIMANAFLFTALLALGASGVGRSEAGKR